MISKHDLVQLAKKEFATTLKVIKAFPVEEGDFRPEGRTRTVIEISRTFVFELNLLEAYLFRDDIDRTRFYTYKPASMDLIAQDFEQKCSEVVHRLDEMPEEDLDKEIEFSGKPWKADMFALYMILDQVHHRGQLSVYIRLAGGKVPSIYGPSEDDPGTNT